MATTCNWTIGVTHATPRHAHSHAHSRARTLTRTHIIRTTHSPEHNTIGAYDGSLQWELQQQHIASKCTTLTHMKQTKTRMHARTHTHTYAHARKVQSISVGTHKLRAHFHVVSPTLRGRTQVAVQFHKTKPKKICIPKVPAATNTN